MTAGTIWGDQLDLMIRARTALIWIRSNEEARVEALLRQTATRLQHQLGCWDFIDGLQGVLNVEGLGSRQPQVGEGAARQVPQCVVSETAQNQLWSALRWTQRHQILAVVRH